MGRRKHTPREELAAAVCLGVLIGCLGPLLAVLLHQRMEG